MCVPDATVKLSGDFRELRDSVFGFGLGVRSLLHQLYLQTAGDAADKINNWNMKLAHKTPSPCKPLELDAPME